MTLNLMSRKPLLLQATRGPKPIDDVRSSSRPLCLMLFALPIMLALGCEQGASEETDLLSLENQRYQAMVQADMELLDAMLDDGLIFTHASGKIDTKSSFLKNLGSGNLIYKTIAIDDAAVRIYDSCGVVTGKSKLEINVRGEDRMLQLRFTTVWIEEESGWKVVAYQSTHAP